MHCQIHVPSCHYKHYVHYVCCPKTNLLNIWFDDPGMSQGPKAYCGPSIQDFFPLAIALFDLRCTVLVCLNLLLFLCKNHRDQTHKLNSNTQIEVSGLQQATMTPYYAI